MSVERLIHATFKISTGNNGTINGSGSGFIYAFCRHGDGFQPGIVTNRHVVAGNNYAEIHVNLMNEDKSPNYGHHEHVAINDFEAQCIMHPDPNIDLAVLPCGAFFGQMKRSGKPVCYSIIDERTLPSERDFADFSGVEPVIMIGYPIGLWDSYNNLPIVRKGITATPLYIDYDNRKEFMVDMACFPGSSGSPVFVYNEGSYVTRQGASIVGHPRLIFVGVLYGGPQFGAKGEIRIVNIPTQQIPIPTTRIPTNLGYCIKAEKVLDFEPLIDALQK